MAQSLKVLCTEQKLEEIAEAIREKKGVSVKYTLDEMPPAIRSIPTGGDPPTGQIDITDITESGQGNPIDVTDYALAYINSPALQAENIRRGTVILGVTGTYGPSGTKSVSMATTSVITEDVASFENVSIQLSGAANITPENIRSGVTFLGVTGSYTPPTLVGTASPADVRATKSFYSDDYTLQTGTMANATIAVEDYQLLPPETIPYGKYLNIQSGYAPEDRTFKPGKPTLSGNAVESQVLVGRTFYSTDVDTQKTGQMPYATFEKASYELVHYDTLAAGQYLNVTAGYNSEARTYKAAEQTVLTGNATPEDVVFNKTFYSNNYAKQTGTMPTVSIQRHTINPSTGLNYQEDDSGRTIYCVYDLDRAPSVNNRNIYLYNVGADGTLSNNTTASTVDSSERFYLGRGIVWDSGGSSIAGYKWQLWKYQYTNGVVYTTKIKDFEVLTKVGPLNSTYSAGEYFVVDPVVSLTNGNLAISQEMVPTPTKWGEVNPGEFVSIKKGYNEENRYVQVNGGTLTGNAIVSHVLTGETFYSDDYNIKHTGTMPYASFTKGTTPSTGALVDELSYGQYVNAGIGYNSTVKSFHAPAAPQAGTVRMEESITIEPIPLPLGSIDPNGSGINISFSPAVSTPPASGPYVTVRGDLDPITISIPATISAGLVDNGVVSTTVIIPTTTGNNVYYPVKLSNATIAIEQAGLLPAEFLEIGEYLNIYTGYNKVERTFRAKAPTLVGTASADDVRIGKSFYSNSYSIINGSLPDSSVTVDDRASVQSTDVSPGKFVNIPKGYVPSTLTYYAKHSTLTGNAIAAQVLKGREFYSDDATQKKTGTMPYATFEKASYQLVPFESLAAGQYLNVTAGYNSEARTYKAAEQTALTGNAAPEDVVFNKTFYSNNYNKQTGAMPTVSIQRHTINPSTGLNYQEDDSGRIIYCAFDLDRAPSTNNRNIYIYNVSVTGTLSTSTTASTVDSAERYYLGRGIVWDPSGSSVTGYKWQLWKYQYTNGVVYTTKIKDFTVLTKIGPLNSTYSAGEYFVVDPVVSSTNGNLAIPQEMTPTPTKWGEVNPGEFVSLRKGYNEENRYIQVNGGTLTGNAIVSHVLTGETFYSDDYNTKHTGTMPYAVFTKDATPSTGAVVDELSYGQYVNASVGYNSTIKSFHAPSAPAAGTVRMEESVTIAPTPASIGTMNPNGSGIGISFAPAVSTPPQTGPYVTVRGDINPITVSIPATISAGLVDDGVASTTVIVPATTGDNVYYPVQLNRATIAIETAGLLPAEFIETGEYLNIYTGYNSSERTFRVKNPTLVGTASASDVRVGQTFYNNTYNIVTGSMPDSSVTVDDAASVQSSDVEPGKFVNIPKGYVGSTLTYYAKHSTLTGDAIAAHVLTGETFYSNDARTKLTGTMPVASSTISATAASLPAPVEAGKYVNIYTGYVQSPVTFYAQPSNLTGNAIASQVLTGREFYSNNANQKLTGTMPYATFEKASYELVSYETLNAGQYLNITAGYNSEARTYRAAAQTSLTGNALPEEVVSGRTFYSNSYEQQTGTMPTVNIRTHAKDPSIGLNYDVDESGRNIYCVFDLDNPPSVNNRNITIFPVDEYGGVDSINVIHSTVDSSERYYLGRKTIFAAVVTYGWELWKYQYTNGVVYRTKIEDYVSGTNVKLGPFNSTYAGNEYYVVEGSSNNLQVPQQIVPTPIFGGTIPMGRYLSILKGYNDTNRYYQAASPTLSGDAQPNEVLAGKKFYSDSMTIKTGTLAATTLSASTTIIPVTPTSSQTITIGNTTDVSIGSRQATTPTIPYIYIESGNERSPISGSFAHIAVSPGVVTDTQTATVYTSVEENKLRYYYPLYITGGGGETWLYGDFTAYGTPSGNVSDQNLYVYCTDALNQSAFLASVPDYGTQYGQCESYMGGPSSSNQIVDYYGFYYCDSENNALDTIILLGSSTAGFHIGTDGFLPPPNQTPSNCWGLSLSFSTGAVRTYKIKIWYDSATSKIKYKYKSV